MADLVFNDAGGNPLKYGDFIAYASMHGQSPGFSYGVVLKVVQPKGSPHDSAPRATKLKIQGLTDWPQFGPNKRASYLERPERVMKIVWTQVPPEVWRRLTEVLDGLKK